MSYEITNHQLSTRERVLMQFDRLSVELGSLARRTVEMQMPDEGDAVAVFMGLGEDERLETALSIWRDGRFPHLLIASSNPAEPSHRTEPELRDYIERAGLDSNGKISVLRSPLHTKDQSDWISETTERLGIRRMALTVPDYHAPRAFATTIDSLNRNGNELTMHVASIDYPEGYVTPDTRYEGEEQSPEFMAGQDARRIPAYQAKGDVASNDEWHKYLDRISA